MIVNKYDPRLKKYDELTKTFAIDAKICAELFESFRPGKKNKLSDQSWIITGPRGAGKSHLLSKLYWDIKNDETLSKYWLPLIFSEELFGVDSLYRLLLHIIEKIFDLKENSGLPEELKTKFENLKKTRLTGNLKSKQEQKLALSGNLFELLSAAGKTLNKKFIFMLENMQDLFSDAMNEDERKALRAFMEENPDVFIIAGTALSVFEHLENYGEPFYHFFKIRSIENLDNDGIMNFLKKIADYRNEQEIIKRIADNINYIYSFKLLTGGNPRLALFLYELLLDNELINTEIILDKIPELTPYFRDKTIEESGQRRLIIDALAFGLPAQSPTEIAQYINEDAKSVNEQLRRLASEGWLREIEVKAEDVSGKEIFYALRDYFYRIWYQTREADIEKGAVYCMAELAAILFDKKTLADKYRICADCDNADKKMMYEQAMKIADDERFTNTMTKIRNEAENIKNEEIKKIYEQLRELKEKQDWLNLIKTAEKLLNYSDKKADGYLKQGYGYAQLTEYEAAIGCYKEAIKIKKDYHVAWYNMGLAYKNKNNYYEAIRNWENAVKIKNDYYEAWFNMGYALYLKNQYQEAYNSFLNYIRYSPKIRNLDYSEIVIFKTIAASIFKPTQELQKLTDKNIDTQTKIRALCAMLLLGKFSAVTDSADEILGHDNLPETEMKQFDFFLRAYLLDALKTPENNAEINILINYMLKSLIKINDEKKIISEFLEFIYNYVKIAGKEKVSLAIIENAAEMLNNEGISISDIIVTIIKSLKKPDTREAQKWMADPLFSEIIRMLNESSSNKESGF